MEKTLIVIAGPTAIGKTSLTIDLAKHFGSEIISADSRQIFKELTIGTAVPGKSQLEAVPHHFIQHKSIHDNYNASAFEHEALAKLEDLFKTHDIVLMTGGSGMYIEAVCSGIDQMPDIDPEVRKKANHLLKTEGKAALQNILKKNDPAYFYETDIQNSARLTRGVEMFWQTGRPFSAFRNRKKTHRNFNIIRIALDMERSELHKRINQRVDEMFAQGLLQEAEQMLPFQHLVPLRTVGYQELFGYFNKNITLDRATELIKRNTRRYARKQLSWFRREPGTKWFHPNDINFILQYIDNTLTNDT